MAGRTSTLINEKAAAMVYENTTSSVQVCSVNTCATVETVNPPLTIKLHTANNVGLNQTVASSTPGGAVTRFLDGGSHQSTWGASASSFYFSGPTADTTRYHQSSAGITGASSDVWKSNRYTCVDPWMFINPSDYFDGKTTTFPFWYAHSNSAYWWIDGEEAWPYFNEMWIEGYVHSSSSAGSQTHPGNSSTTYATSPGYAQSNYPQCHDWYTAGTISMTSNNYMTYDYPYRSSGAGSSFSRIGGNRTSDSTLYDIFQGNNPISYLSDNPFDKLLQAERGIFVVTNSEFTTNNYCWINPAANNSVNGYQMTGVVHWEDATGSTNYASDTVNNSTNSGVRITMTVGNDFQWIKYNKTAGKYYICSKAEGIFSFTESDFFGAGTSYNNSSSGFAGASWLTRVADYPFGTDIAQQPSKIGQNLWVTITDQDVLYYSADLVTWQTAAQYLASVLPSLSSPSSYGTLAIDNTGSSPAYYFGGASWSKFESGIDNVPNAGLLEKSEQAGTFERTGVILAPGDSIYIENDSVDTKVGVTVMYVEV